MKHPASFYSKSPLEMAHTHTHTHTQNVSKAITAECCRKHSPSPQCNGSCVKTGEQIKGSERVWKSAGYQYCAELEFHAED